VLDNDFGVSRICYDRRIRSSLGMFLSNHLIVYTSAQNLVSTPNISKVMYDDQGLNGGGFIREHETLNTVRGKFCSCIKYTIM
jgi:hypothetical protein